MEIVKLDLDETYVLVMPDASAAQAERIIDSLRTLKEQGGGLCCIYGMHVTFVPASQVVGYKVLDAD